MNHVEYLLTCLAEESVEVAQRATKAMRFGCSEIQPGQGLTNAQRIGQELHDLFAIVELLGEAGVLEWNYDTHAIERKKAKVVVFMDYSRECGALS